MARKTKKTDAAKDDAKKPAPVEDVAAAATSAEADAIEQGPMLQVLVQYTKDASFENPSAPDSLRGGQPNPDVGVNLGVNSQVVGDDTVEVTVSFSVKATRGDQVAFICKLEYGGVFAFRNISMEEIQPLIMIECPRLLFPFARQIIAEMISSGGFPPILLETPDYAAIFRQELMRRAEAQNSGMGMGEPQGTA